VPLIVDTPLPARILDPPDRSWRRYRRAFADQFLGGQGNSLGGIIVDAGTFDWSKDNNIRC